MSDLLQLKKEVYTKCMTLVEDKIRRAKKAMEAAQEAANSETKSSAGDKYETGRAMMQLEKDRAAAQLAEGLKLQKGMYQVDPEKEHEIIELGSLVITNNGNFYLAISLGKITVEQSDYFVISPASPISANLIGSKKDDSISFNGRSYKILNVV